MPGIGSINLKVVILDTDYYAMQCINSYLAWDRRTRVTFMTTDVEAFWDYMRDIPSAEFPDVVIVDGDHLGDFNESSNTSHIKDLLNEIQSFVPRAMLICMSQTNSPRLVEAVAQTGARAFLLKHDVGMQIAWAIVYARKQEFLITHNIARMMKGSQVQRVYQASVLPEQREYPEMTGRIRQAIRLCVVEGMPAHLAADEMGISLHTIRGYIKEGYRILESYDQYEYPTDMTPQERAFMRFTALANEKNQA